MVRLVHIAHVRTSPLWDALPELARLSLVCDCLMDQLCEADLLVGLYFDAAPPESSPTNRGAKGKWSRTVALLQGIQALPRGMALPMMSLVLAFRMLLPEKWYQNFKFAMVEDLVNSPPFCSYPAWLAERGEAWDGPLVPHLAAGAVRQLARIGDGCQVGAMTHRAALPPLLPFNLDPDAHFGRALQRAQLPVPYEDMPVSDLDLEYVAGAYVAPRQTRRAWRQRAVGALRELKRRWEGVTLHLHAFQEPAVHQVTKQRDIGFLALLMILTSWADTGFPYGLVQGLPAVGYAPLYGIFPQQPAERISMAEVLEGRQEHNQHILNQLKAGKDDAFLLQQIHGGTPGTVFAHLLCGERSSSGTSETKHIVLSHVVSSPKVQGNNEPLTTATLGVNLTYLPMPTSLHFVARYDQPSTSASSCTDGLRKKSPSFVRMTPGRQAKKTCHLPTGTAPCRNRRAWAASWYGFTMNGKPQRTKSTKSTRGFCLHSRWQSLPSTDFPDCWKR